jgi:hypothetical protein
VYTTLAPDFAWEGHGKTLKVEVDVSGAAPALKGPPQALWDKGGYTGGLSWDGRYLCGGGGHVAMLDLKGTKGRPDTLSLDGIQSCNASISSSRGAPGTMMYLNTSGKHPAVDGGTKWGEWQVILIGNAAGALVRGYRSPREFKHPPETVPPSLSETRWHHNEWSNHPYFAAATLNADRYFKVGDDIRNTKYQERLYLINLKDSAYLEVLRPDSVRYRERSFGGFFWPSLWVEVPAGFQEAAGWLDARGGPK